jgi:hypothetical protein
MDWLFDVTFDELYPRGAEPNPYESEAEDGTSWLEGGGRGYSNDTEIRRQSTAVRSPYAG